MIIHFLSNGNGEDQIASNLMQSLEGFPDINCYAFPLVGLGLEYKKKGVYPMLHNPSMPSGGFVRSWKTALLDLFNGVLKLHLSQLKTMRELAPKTTATFCVGDVFCLLMGRLSGHKTLIFLPTAKSDTFMQHSWLEMRLIKAWASLVFTRDHLTELSFKKAGLPVHYLGNPMFDNLTPTGNTFGLRADQPKLGILPGSREEAYPNLSYILSCIPTFLSHNPDLHFIVAFAPTLTIEKLSLPKGWAWNQTQTTLNFNHQATVTFSSHFPDVLDNVNVVIGLSGTANEQAIYFGKQVVCFEGFGPQSTKIRFIEQQRLMGKSLHFSETRSPDILAKKCIDLLTQFPSQKNTPFPIQNASQAIIEKSLAHIKTI